MKEMHAWNEVPQNAVKRQVVDRLICAGASWAVIKMWNRTARRERPWLQWLRSIRARKTGVSRDFLSFLSL